MRRRAWLVLFGVAVQCGCVPALPPEGGSALDPAQPDGSVVWQGEYAFAAPPPPWELLDLNENELSLAYFKSCAGDQTAPCETSLAYAEEPFGFSRELPERAREFFHRHLWGARVEFTPPVMTTGTFGEHHVLLAEATGVEPVKGEKVLTRAAFFHRGERVVAIYLNQWRPQGDPFDPDDFAVFERFVASFRFLRPSFYEKL